MKKEIKVNYITENKLTKQLCLETAKYLIWYNWLFAPFIVVGILLVLTLPFYLFYGCPLLFALKDDIGFFPGVVLLLVIFYLPRLLGKKLYEKSGQDENVKMFFYQNEIEILKENEKKKISYKEVQKIKERKNYFFLHIGLKKDAMLYTINKNSFILGNNEDFYSYIKAKLDQ